MDLKELEKFGFELNKKEWYALGLSNGTLFVKPLTKIIVYNACNTAEYADLSILYDLIQAGIVEKI